MGTSRFFPLLFLVVSIFGHSIFSVENDNFGQKGIQFFKWALSYFQDLQT